MNRIIVTGGAGFIGSAVARHIINDTNESDHEFANLVQHIRCTSLENNK